MNQGSKHPHQLTYTFAHMEGVCDTPLQFSAIYRKHNGPIEVGDARAYLHTRLELKARHELDDELVLFRDVDQGLSG